MSAKKIPEMIPMKCCGSEGAFSKVFKREYMGLAFEFKCKHCKHYAASPDLYAAIRAWNQNIDRRIIN
jgi:hypothetical protein